MTKKIRFQTLDRGTGIAQAKRKPLVKSVDAASLLERKASHTSANAPETPVAVPVMPVVATVIPAAEPKIMVPKDLGSASEKPKSKTVVASSYPQTWVERSFWWLSALCLDFVFVAVSVLSLVIVPKLLGLHSFGLFYEFAFWLAKINIWELLALGSFCFFLYLITFRWLAGETLGSMLFVKTTRS